MVLFVRRYFFKATYYVISERMVCTVSNQSVLLVSMPFADISLPSIQLSLLESYLKENNIPVSSLHLYLFAAETYGLHNYTSLINPPNDPYISQMIFSKYVFPHHWEKNKEKFKTFYKKNIANKPESTRAYTFEEYEQKTDYFLTHLIDGIQWDQFDIIGFSLNYGQFLPSLAVAKQIKQRYPEKIIVLGGSTTMNDLGIRLIQTFDYIDFIISGEGEESLTKLAKNTDAYNEIPGLISKQQSKGVMHKPPSFIDINSLPFPDYTSFYQQVQMSSSEIQQYIQLNSRLPIELSRGCYWNKCRFCNQQAYHPIYREKQINRFVEELNYLSETYNMLSFQIIGSVLPPKNLQSLCESIHSLEKDFQLIAEARADRLTQKEYYWLKKAGFHTIQTGIESFSSSYLKKMNKGARVIDNIAALKYCKQYHINNQYNIIVNFPTEDSNDFNETIETISFFAQYVDPPRMSPFVVGYKSPVYNDLEKYNVKKLIPKKIDSIMYPKEFLEQNTLFFYDFVKKNKLQAAPSWSKIIESWKHQRKQDEITAVNTANIIDDLRLYYIDGGSFLKVFDKRNHSDVIIYNLTEKERTIFLACNEIISFENLTHQVSEIQDREIQNILNEFIDTKIMYREQDSYLSLPISLSEYLGNHKKLENKRNIRESALCS